MTEDQKLWDLVKAYKRALAVGYYFFKAEEHVETTIEQLEHILRFGNTNRYPKGIQTLRDECWVKIKHSNQEEVVKDFYREFIDTIDQIRAGCSLYNTYDHERQIVVWKL
jgi:hypothetical protein